MYKIFPLNSHTYVYAKLLFPPEANKTMLFVFEKKSFAMILGSHDFHDLVTLRSIGYSVRSTFQSSSSWCTNITSDQIQKNNIGS